MFGLNSFSRNLFTFFLLRVGKHASEAVSAQKIRSKLPELYFRNSFCPEEEAILTNCVSRAERSNPTNTDVKGR
jgi:hypothetical protein